MKLHRPSLDKRLFLGMIFIAIAVAAGCSHASNDTEKIGSIEWRFQT
jgi:hypothetical protein